MRLFLILPLLMFHLLIHAGSGPNVHLKITDSLTGEGLIFTAVRISGESSSFGGATDIDGKLSLKVDPGEYLLSIRSMEYESYSKSITILEDSIYQFSIGLVCSDQVLSEFMVIGSKTSRIKRSSGAVTISRKDIRKIPGRNACCIATYVGGLPASFGTHGVENRERYEHASENQFKKVSTSPLSTFSIDVDNASYANVRRYINNGSTPPPDAIRLEEMINYFDYDYPQPAGEHPFSVTAEYAECPWNSEHKVARVGIQGKNVMLDELPPNNLVFLIDVSGSMNNQNKLPLVKKSLQLLVDSLRFRDRVAMVLYAGTAGVILESMKANEKGKEKILDALGRLRSGGSTAGGAGIQKAYEIARKNFIKNGNNRVILCTDGDFNVGISDDNELVKMMKKNRKEGVFLTVLGFGMGNYQDARLEKIADRGNGNYAYIDNIREARKMLVNQMTGTLLTIAKDVKFQIEFNPKYVKEYRLIGYENRLLEEEDFNNDKKDAGELGAGHCVTAVYEIVPRTSPEEIASVDRLRYQESTPVENNETEGELMNVKLRYKEPDGIRSKLMVQPVDAEPVREERMSEDMRFICAVIEFGLVLSNSGYPGNSNLDHAAEMARTAGGKDQEGYRSEFIQLVETAKLIE